MSGSGPATVTQLLEAVSRGRGSAADRLWSLIYDELHALAKRQLAKDPLGRTMQPTSLVHEAYLRLVGNEDVQWANRRHFFAAAGRAMLRIRIEAARRRDRLKRGGGQKRVPLDEAAIVFDEDAAELLRLEEALDRLKEIDKRKADVVVLRYLVGLSVKEVAQALDISTRTVESDWKFARAWLHRELKKGASSAGIKG